MASDSEGEDEITLDAREQLARIEKLEAEISKLKVERRLATPQAVFQGGLSAAALAAAAVAAIKLFV